MCISRNYNTGSTNPLVVPGFSKDIHYVQKPSISEFIFENKRNNDSHHTIHQVVFHDYHDHSNDIDDGSPDPIARGGVTTPFPIKLHQMLDDIERDGYGDVVAWQPHGRCFVVHKPKAFVNHIMPTYFKQSKFASFQRQLNLYGFQRLTKGADKGGYYNELFLRGKVFLAHRIQRMRVKGTGVRARSSPETEPDFRKMPPVVNSPTVRDDEGEASVLAVTSTTMTPVHVKSEPSRHDDATDDENDDEMDIFDVKDLGFFEGMKFHLLDHNVFADREANDASTTTPTNVFSQSEMESFLNQLNISTELYQDIVDTVDNDTSFGDLLQRVIE